jgi:cellulose 1,4-beta-cellobiosidase
MDIWEANSNAAAFTPHPCSSTGQTMCTGDDCTRDTGLCDADGCDFNSFRMGDQSFYGKGLTVDTSQKFTVVTQFITSDNTTTGTLSQIRRIYVQNGKVIQNSVTDVAGIDTTNAISDNFCTEQKAAFGDTDYFAQKGGLKKMGTALGTGMVLSLSIWDDYSVSMLWLDSDYPTNAATTAPGVARGTCATTSGVPAQIESQSPNAQVIFSNIKFGDIGSTFSGTSSPGTGPGSSSSVSTPHSSSVSSASPSPSSPAGTAAHYGQCGGIGYTGPTTCASPYTCQVSNPCEYLHCLPNISYTDQRAPRLLPMPVSG